MMMASIASTIELYDRVSAPINNMIGAISNMIGAYHSLDGAMKNGLDPGRIHQAEAALVQAQEQVDQLGDYITQNERKQERFNDEVRKGESAADGLTQKIMGMVGAYASVQGLQKLVNLSDTAVQTTARLKLILDDENTIEELEDKIMASANRARASYQTTADAVAKLGMQAGKAFNNSNDEVIAFSELLNKSFVIAGTEAQGVESVMLQIRQAMAAGKLQGEELNAILDNAQPIVANIQKYLEEVQNIDASNIKKLASEGKITADVIKKAMFYAADDINEAFDSMPMTWSQVWTGVMNKLYEMSKPVLSVISFMAQNWSFLGPIVIGLATAVGLYTGALLINKGVQTASTIATTIATIAKLAHKNITMEEAIATTGMTKAQLAFNASLYASPLTWVVLAIIAVIAIIYAVIAAINKWKGTTISATGVIVGALATAGAFIWNLFLGLLDIVLAVVNRMWNKWAMFANFFGNLFNDPIASIIHLFGDMADSVLGILENIAKAIDKVFGSNLAGAVQGWRSGLDSMVETAANKYGNGSYEKVMEEINLSSESLGLSRLAYGDAYNAGYGWGANAGDAVSDAFDTNGMTDNIAETAENTGKAAGSLEVAGEDLKYLRDIAERDTINRFTTAEIKVDMTNHNSINKDMDLDGVVDYLVVGVNEAMSRAAEGVHV